MTDLTAGVLEREGCPLHYWVGGAEGKPLVVLTHGACVDHHSWDAQIPVLIDKYRLLLWDARGHGQSQPMGTPFTVPLGADDLLALIDTTGYEKAILVGHSNGSYMSQELTFRHPKRVQAMVVVDATCITWRRTTIEMAALRSALAMAAPFPFEMMKRVGLLFNTTRADVRAYLYRAFSQIPKREFIQILTGAASCLHPEPGYVIAQPLLLMHGAADRFGDIIPLSPKWAAREPNCAYAVIPKARHFSMMDNPDFFNQHLLDFLAHWAE